MGCITGTANFMFGYLFTSLNIFKKVLDFCVDLNYLETMTSKTVGEMLNILHLKGV